MSHTSESFLPAASQIQDASRKCCPAVPVQRNKDTTIILNGRERHDNPNWTIRNFTTSQTGLFAISLLQARLQVRVAIRSRFSKFTDISHLI
jgi:hypothetical protein